MKIRFVARKFTLTDDVKERVQKKLQKLDKFFSSDTEAAVALYGEKIGERIEVTIYHGGTIFRAEESDKDIACALDKALDVIERQIRKNRTRLEKKIHITKDSFADPADQNFQNQAVRDTSDDGGGGDYADEPAVAFLLSVPKFGNGRTECGV